MAIGPWIVEGGMKRWHEEEEQYFGCLVVASRWKREYLSEKEAEIKGVATVGLIIVRQHLNGVLDL